VFKAKAEKERADFVGFFDQLDLARQPIKSWRVFRIGER
jgi:hypothetical protein